MKKTAIIILIFICSIYSCKKEQVHFWQILNANVWRKTEIILCNGNSQAYEYLYTFDLAKDCEKNGFYEFRLRNINALGSCNQTDACNDTVIWYNLKFQNDSLSLMKYNSDDTITWFLEYFDESTFTLRTDTFINSRKKLKKVTFSAF